jgi:hypothetical protein
VTWTTGAGSWTSLVVDIHPAQKKIDVADASTSAIGLELIMGSCLQNFVSLLSQLETIEQAACQQAQFADREHSDDYLSEFHGKYGRSDIFTMFISKMRSRALFGRP